MNQEICGHKVIGALNDIPAILSNMAIDQVLFIVPRSWIGRIEKPLLYCETVGVRVSVAVDLFNLQFTTGKEEAILGLPLITFESTPDKMWSLLIKRCLDAIIAAACMIVFAPILLMVALAVRLTSKGPVLFRQKRCSLNGRAFFLYKFRTMVQDAELRLKDLLQQNEMKGPVFKMTNDPRLTKIGKVLRKYSLDELPQLWNVIRGDMSLVGPRPPIPSEVKQYDSWQRRRLSMRPGITCLWQANGRNKITDFNEWMKLDLQYIDNWSIWLDFQILFKTIPSVLSGMGAK